MAQSRVEGQANLPLPVLKAMATLLGFTLAKK